MESTFGVGKEKSVKTNSPFLKGDTGGFERNAFRKSTFNAIGFKIPLTPFNKGALLYNIKVLLPKNPNS
jgi:hypothetical protein